MSEWIRIKDTCPASHEKVLVINLGMTDVGRYENVKWFSLCWKATMPEGAITHWMPLPELSIDN